MDREELRRRFESGERDFSSVDWSGANLHSLDLSGIIPPDSELKLVIFGYE